MRNVDLHLSFHLTFRSLKLQYDLLLITTRCYIGIVYGGRGFKAESLDKYSTLKTCLANIAVKIDY